MDLLDRVAVRHLRRLAKAPETAQQKTEAKLRQLSQALLDIALKGENLFRGLVPKMEEGDVKETLALIQSFFNNMLYLTRRTKDPVHTWPELVATLKDLLGVDAHLQTLIHPVPGAIKGHPDPVLTWLGRVTPKLDEILEEAENELAGFKPHVLPDLADKRLGDILHRTIDREWPTEKWIARAEDQGRVKDLYRIDYTTAHPLRIPGRRDLHVKLVTALEYIPKSLDAEPGTRAERYERLKGKFFVDIELGTGDSDTLRSRRLFWHKERNFNTYPEAKAALERLTKEILDTPWGKLEQAFLEGHEIKATRKKRAIEVLERTTLTEVWGKLGKQDPETLIFVYHPKTGKFEKGLASKIPSHTVLRKRIGEGGPDASPDVRGFWIPSERLLALYQMERLYQGLVDPPESIFTAVVDKLNVGREVDHWAVIE